MIFVPVFTIKGGEGKTTLTIVSADYLATKRDKKVLLVDLDAQGTLSDHFEPNRDDVWSGKSLRSLCHDRSIDKLQNDLRQVIIQGAGSIKSSKENIDLIPAASYDLNELNTRQLSYEEKVRSAHNFREAILDFNYDYVIFDMPPAQPFNVMPYLSFAHRVLIPLVPVPLSIKCLDFTQRAIKQSWRFGPNEDIDRSVVVVFSRIRPPNEYQNSMRLVERSLITSSPIPNIRSVRSQSRGSDGLMQREDLEFRDEGRTYKNFTSKYFWSRGIVGNTVVSAFDLNQD